MSFPGQSKLGGVTVAAAPADAPGGRVVPAPYSLTQTERRLRWFFVVWLTGSTILNVIDKNTLAILGPTLKNEFGLSNEYFATLLNAFMISYAIMYTVGGRLVDRWGEKISMTLFVSWWSISCMLQAFARGALSLGIFRFMLGLGEPGNYPAALRSTTNWFRKDERGLPISIWSVGSSVGGLVAPPMVAFLAIAYGWRVAFFLPGCLGLLWALGWMFSYRLPARPIEIESSPSAVRNPEAEEARKPESLLQLLKDSRVRAIVLARMVSDGVWLFYISWLPLYLSERWGYNLKDIGLYAWIPFLFGAAGGVFGGSFSDRLVRRGVPSAVARKRVLFAAGLVAPLGVTVGFAHSSAIALGLIAVVAFVVYIWFITTAALVTDVFPRRVVASVLGLMGTAGTLGGMALNWFAGYILDHYHSYTPIFFVAGSGHLVATLILFLLLKEKNATGAAGGRIATS
jgi:MFS transporter, ACS family, aldohexuronate transporter